MYSFLLAHDVFVLVMMYFFYELYMLRGDNMF